MVYIVKFQAGGHYGIQLCDEKEWAEIRKQMADDFGDPNIQFGSQSINAQSISDEDAAVIEKHIGKKFGKMQNDHRLYTFKPKQNP